MPLRSLLIILFVFIIAFLSGWVFTSSDIIMKVVDVNLKPLINYHISNLAVDAKHYFLLPDGGYTDEVLTKPVTVHIAFFMIANSLFNAMFQPLFLSVFTPQVVLVYLLFPFFLYGMVKYFRKLPLIFVVFFLVLIYVGFYGSVIEALIRHRMSCELLYFLISLGGFTSWITRRLS
ncbi:MAG: hypothetical protein WC779_02680 [Candidatus Omnitrophota bacterium]